MKHLMRGVGASMAALLSTAAFAAGDGRGAVTDGVRVLGTAKAAKVVLGGPVIVTGTLTNERTDKIVLGSTDPLGGFRVIIHDPRGRLVPPNASGKHLLTLARPTQKQLAPGEDIQQTIWISSLYDLRTPGKYTLEMTRDVPRASGAGTETVKSNTFTVVLTK